MSSKRIATAQLIETSEGFSLYRLYPPIYGDGALQKDNRYGKALVGVLDTPNTPVSLVMPYDDSNGKLSKTDAFDYRWLSVPEKLSDAEALARINVELIPGVWTPDTSNLKPVTLIVDQERKLSELSPLAVILAKLALADKPELLEQFKTLTSNMRMYRTEEGTGIAGVSDPLRGKVMLFRVDELSAEWMASNTPSEEFVLAKAGTFEDALAKAGYFHKDTDLNAGRELWESELPAEASADFPQA